MRKIFLTCMLVLLATTAFMTGDTTAAWWDKKKETKQAERVNRLPGMTFLRGRMQQDNKGEWELNYTKLRLLETTTMTDARGRDWTPVPGRPVEVMLMGYYAGEYFVVQSGRVFARTLNPENPAGNPHRIQSESDPNVGELANTTPM